MVLFKSERPNLTVHNTNNEQIAQFIGGKFGTENKKVIKTLRTLEGVREVDLAGEDFFDAKKFKEKAEIENEKPAENQDQKTEDADIDDTDMDLADEKDGEDE